MSKNFNYYYGSQADQFSFIRIPKIMLIDNTFSDLSLQAKVLYGVLLDRMSLSRKNGWLDAENRVFIIYQIVFCNPLLTKGVYNLYIQSTPSIS